MTDPTQYDSFAGAYGEFAESAPYNAYYDRPATLGLVGEVAGRQVLDAGCGPGFYLEELVARGAEVTGFDASSEMVAVARDRVGDGVPVRVHSMDDPLDWLGDGTMDLVVCALAYHYANDRPAFLVEVHRILRPGGAMVISTHHPIQDWARLGGSYFTEEPVTETWSRGWVITAHRCPLTQLTSEIFEAGFLIERLVEPQPVPEMASSHPEASEKLSRSPAFLLLRLLKRP